MLPRKFFTEQAAGLLILLVIGILAGVLYFLSGPPHHGQPANNGMYEAYRTTLSGEYVCLPPTDTTGPQTLECALGLKADDGKYYALDFNLMSQMQTELKTGDRISAAGLVTPVQRLNTDHWQKYPIVGIFSVTDSFKKE